MARSEGDQVSRECRECGEEFAVAPGWNDYHVKIEKWWSGGTGLSKMYFCSTKCAITGLEENHV